jgi:hypothetical protein
VFGLVLNFLGSYCFEVSEKCEFQSYICHFNYYVVLLLLQCHGRCSEFSGRLKETITLRNS